MNKFRNENNNKAINWGKVLATTKAGVVYPTDVDGMLERCGHFLALEWKHYSVQEIPKGQDITYRKLAALPEFTCLYVFGDYDTWRVHKVLKIGQHDKPVETTNEHLLWYMRKWWERSTQNPIRTVRKPQRSASSPSVHHGSTA